MLRFRRIIPLVAALGLVGVGVAKADEGHEEADPDAAAAAIARNAAEREELMLAMPRMDGEAGRYLFAAKGCVVCHAVNGVGGEDAPALDADHYDGPMNPFDFAAGMWRGAAAMILLQEDELGGQIELTGAELAAIVAFAHDPEEQAKFSEADIPPEIDAVMHKDE